MTSSNLSNKEHGYIKLQLNYAPKTNGKKFKAWCDDNGFVPLNSGRRGWSSSLSTYLRGASGIAYADGEPFLFYEEDLVDVEVLIKAAQHQLLTELTERSGDYYAIGSSNPYSVTQAVPVSVIEQKLKELG